MSEKRGLHEKFSVSFQLSGTVYLGSTMHCYDILSGGASVTGYSTLKKARKVAIASFSMATECNPLGFDCDYGFGVIALS